MLSYLLLFAFFNSSRSQAPTPIPAHNLTNNTHPATVIYQYPPVTWVENIGVRPNGLLLPVTITSPLLNQLNPITGSLSLVYDFSAAGNAIQSITKIKKDIFIVDVTTCNLSALACTGLFSSWEVDFRLPGTESGRAKVRKLAEFPDAGFLNGMAALNPRMGVLLIADSLLGGIWRLDTSTGATELMFTDKSMMGSADIAFGINGVRVRRGRLWFTNTGKGTLSWMPIDPVTAQRRGNATVVADGLLGPDDSELDDAERNAYVTDIFANQLLRIPTEGGDVEVVAELAGPTSARWATCRRGKANLYVSTSGGFLQYVQGNVTVGGSIVRFDVNS